MNIQLHHHAVRKSWLLSFQITEQLTLRILYFYRCSIFQIAYINFKLALWTEGTSNCITMLQGRAGFYLIGWKGSLNINYLGFYQGNKPCAVHPARPLPITRHVS